MGSTAGATKQVRFKEGQSTVEMKLSHGHELSNGTSGDRKRLSIRALSFFRYFFSRISLLLLVYTFIAVSLTRTGLFETQRLESTNVTVLDSVNALLPTIDMSIDSFSGIMGSERQNIGSTLEEEGAVAKHPIIMIPGFVSSGLEVWTARECAKGYFRQRLWATLSIARTFLVDRECWKEHLMLDTRTGGDPAGIRLRASEGFAAADYFVANYWVWGKLVENLAAVGYNPSNMAMQAYDWRLPFSLLEERDGYFTALKHRVEAMYETSGRKVALISHSMGSLVVHHFFGWVVTDVVQGGGGGGSSWVDEHIEFYFNIAGPLLGVPKAATALLSGEMSDTVFGGTMTSLVESFFGRQMRRDLWSSWGSLWAMLPTGGNTLWGPGVDLCVIRTSEDPHCPETQGSLTPLIAMTDAKVENSSPSDEPQHQENPLTPLFDPFLSRSSHLMSEILDFLVALGDGVGHSTFNSIAYSQSRKAHATRPAWHDVSSSPLPHAPSMTIFCLYGTGLQTERAYYYKRNKNDASVSETNAFIEPAIVMDPINDEKTGARNGIRYSDGDGSVPLLSLGYICVDAWKRRDTGLNPSQTQVYTREYMHQTQFSPDDPMRGGPQASDHIDILGNVAMMEDIIRVVTGFHSVEATKDQIVSEIQQMAASLNSHNLGGLSRRRSWMHMHHFTSSMMASTVQKALPQHVYLLHRTD